MVPHTASGSSLSLLRPEPSYQTRLRTRSPFADSARPADLVEEIAQPARDEDLLAGKERLRRDVHAIFVSLALSLWAS